MLKMLSNIKNAFNDFTEEYPIVWGLIKWLAIGTAITLALYFSGGLAVIFLAPVDPIVLPAIIAWATVFSAAMWEGWIKPFGKWLGKKCGFCKDTGISVKIPEREFTGSSSTAAVAISTNTTPAGPVIKTTSESALPPLPNPLPQQAGGEGTSLRRGLSNS